MLGPDDLTQVADVALSRVQLPSDEVRLANPCHIDHADIARAGVEEGLKLALRLLQGRFGSPVYLSANNPVTGRASDAGAPTPADSPQDSWR